jgi:zinc protease
VILEELAMHASEPWDALEMDVQARLFAGHSYGRPVLGTREELLATGPADLGGFHRRFYRPDNAVLVVAGDVGPGDLEAVERALGGLPAGADARPASEPPVMPSRLERLTRRKGEVPRLLLALPGPQGAHPDHPAVRLLTTLLASGRASRLHRALVDEDQLCVWVSADVSEGWEAGQIAIGAEVVPGVDPARVEAALLRHLADLAATPPSAEEVERSKQIALADWVFGHERVHQQALSAGFALALFDLDHLERSLRALLAASPEELGEIAARYFDLASGVVGWSLPRADA